MDMFGSGNSLFDFESDEEIAAPHSLDDDYYAALCTPAASEGISGAELRRRLITPEALAAIHAEEPKKSLLQRILHRK